MNSLRSCLLSAKDNLASADECVQPFSPQARKIDQAVKLLESIDCQDDHHVVFP